MNKIIIALLFLTLLPDFSSAVYATEEDMEKTSKAKKGNPWTLLMPVASRHPGDHRAGKKPPNEKNWGVGLKYDNEKSFWGETQYVQGAAYKNSFGGLGLVGSYGMNKELTRSGDFGFSAGGVVGLGIYQYPEDRYPEKKKWGLIGGIAPVLSVDYKKLASLSILIVPSLKNGSGVEVYCFFLSIPFRTFEKLGI